MAIDDIISAGQKNRREGGSRRSASRAIVFWTITLLAGAGSAVMLKWYVDKQQAAAPALSQVVVARLDLPAATTLKAEHLTLVDWPIKARPPGSFSKIEDLVGRVLVARSLLSEPILAPRLAAREAGSGLAALIPDNMRAAAVRVDDVVGVAGFVHPEDRVDVIVTIRPHDGEPTAKVILQNVKVLAVGVQVDVEAKNRGKAMPVTVATLLVTPEQSEKLALASSQGKLLLTLRSWTDEGEVATTGVAATGLLGDARKPAAVAETRPRPSESRRPRPEKVAQAPAPAPSTNVEILRGDRFEERKFDGQNGQKERQ